MVQNAIGFAKKPHHGYHYWLSPWRSASIFSSWSHIASVSTVILVFDLPLIKRFASFGFGPTDSNRSRTMDSNSVTSLTHNYSKALFGWVIEGLSCPGFKYPSSDELPIWGVCCKQSTALYLLRTSVSSNKIVQWIITCSQVFRQPSSIYLYHFIPSIFHSHSYPLHAVPSVRIYRSLLVKNISIDPGPCERL